MTREREREREREKKKKKEIDKQNNSYQISKSQTKKLYDMQIIYFQTNICKSRERNI